MSSRVSVRQKSADWQVYAETISEKLSRAFLDPGPGETLLRALIVDVAPKAQRDAIRRLEEENGINEIIPWDSHPEIKNELVDPVGPLWTPRGSSPMEEKLAKAATSSIVQCNALALLHLWLSIERRGDEGLKANLKALIETTEIVRPVWWAATARPLQFRRLKDLREVRDSLIALGAIPDAMEIPAWLAPN
jgi:hypothetical protein